MGWGEGDLNVSRFTTQMRSVYLRTSLADQVTTSIVSGLGNYDIKIILVHIESSCGARDTTSDDYGIHIFCAIIHA